MCIATINTPWLTIAGTVGMLFLIIAIIFFVVIHQRRVIKLQLDLQKTNEQQQKKLLEAAIQSEETERKRISSDLHDEVGALLSTIKLYLNQIQPSVLNDNSKIPVLNNCKQLIDDTITTVRSISSNLQPATIKDFGLESTLHGFSEKLKNSTTVKSSFAVQGPIERFDIEKELAVFRIVQELTNNVLKHAQADCINYALIQKNKETLQVFIEHNGNGLSQEDFEQNKFSKDGLGLKNIQNRLNILKANIRFEKNSDRLNTVSCQIPVI